jgi:hypothetical protein
MYWATAVLESTVERYTSQYSLFSYDASGTLSLSKSVTYLKSVLTSAI